MKHPIHELTEQECLTYFPVTLKGIELILEQMYQIREEERLITETKAELNKIQSELKNNQAVDKQSTP